ncbi:MAG: hypothetical protein JO250_04855 [Armatimonadetes bacterium]|nr:hypothetical protein [Armatimonadota bacterium]
MPEDNESGPTLSDLAGHVDPTKAADSVPATGVASAAGGGALDPAVVGTSTEILGAGSDGGDAEAGVVHTGAEDSPPDAVTGTGAGAGTGELDTMQTGTAQTEAETGGGPAMDTAARDATLPRADTQPNPPD